MKCSMNRTCLDLSKELLPNTRDAVKDNFNDINERIENMELELKELNIPNDFIGNKLNIRLEELYEQFEYNINDNANIIDDFNNYIDNEIIIHSSHYSDWKKQEEEKEKEKEELE